MTDHGVPDDDMPIFSWLRRRDVSPIEDTSLVAMLDQTESPPGLEAVAEALASLRAAPRGDELAGQAAAMAEFRQRFGVSHHHRRSRRRRPTLITSLPGTRAAAAAAAVAALSLSGAAAAAFTGALPAPVQRLAHTAIGAPSPSKPASHHPVRGGSPTGPKATGSAAFGLCTAYAHAKTHGTPNGRDVAFRNLVKAAGGAGKVASFCSAVTHPGRPASHRHGSRRPSSHPNGRSSGHPAGPPTEHPTGPPPAHPAGPPAAHPAGLTSTHPPSRR